jgi:GNAT superfamily N-acetyltransferase
MDKQLVYEVIGYAGSALIIVSVLQQSILKLRVVGLIGSVTFFTYGLLIAAYPIAAVNLIVGGIHVYYLHQLVRRPHEVFSVLHVDRGSKQLEHFLEFHDDISQHAATDALDSSHPGWFAAFVLKDTQPAGLIIGEHNDDGTVEIKLDYVTPQYRDFKIGQYLYSHESGVFRDTSFREAWTVPHPDSDETYFKRLGFEPSPTAADPNRYSVDLRSVRDR